MLNNVFRKNLTIVIILLFVGACVLPIISGTNKDENFLSIYNDTLNVIGLGGAINRDIEWLWAINTGGTSEDEGINITVEEMEITKSH